MGREKIAKPVRTDVTLLEIHDELKAKLLEAHGKPVFISVTYLDKDTNKLKHWQGNNHDFPKSDLMSSLVEIGKLVQDEITR